MYSNPHDGNASPLISSLTAAVVVPVTIAVDRGGAVAGSGTHIAAGFALALTGIQTGTDVKLRRDDRELRGITGHHALPWQKRSSS